MPGTRLAAAAQCDSECAARVLLVPLTCSLILPFCVQCSSASGSSRQARGTKTRILSLAGVNEVDHQTWLMGLLLTFDPSSVEGTSQPPPPRGTKTNIATAAAGNRRDPP